MRRARRAQREDGFAMVAAIVVLAVALLVSGATLTFALRGITSSTHSRNEEASIHAADAGVNVALWRTNKILVSNEPGSLFGFLSGAIQTLGCLAVTAGNPPIITINTSNTPAGATGAGQGGQPFWCSETPPESAGSGATFRYYESTALSVAGGGGLLALTRRVVSLGTSGPITRRLLAVFTVSLGSNKNPLSLWKQIGYFECPSVVPSASAPDSGCPYPSSP